MASKYYDSAGKEVFDGDIALAADLNTINSGIDSGFQVVESDLSGILVDINLYTDLAEKWAEHPEDVEVTSGKYSAHNWAIKAEDQATIATTQAGYALDSRNDALDFKNLAGASALQADNDVILTHADVVSTHADVITTAASVSSASYQAGIATAQAIIATNQAAIATGLVDDAIDVINSAEVIEGINVDNYTATSNQTEFLVTSAVPSNNLLVFLNTRKIKLTDDYTVDNSSAVTKITLSIGATAGDEIEILALSTYELDQAVYNSNQFFMKELVRFMTPSQGESILTSANIVDVFIYDTSKDSDLGEWRLSCQDLSWYNEPLNTATRGATREFPAVALIVAETTKITIFDATVAGCPVWMVFNAYAGNPYRIEASGLFALNSILSISMPSGGLSVINFVGDFSTLYAFGSVSSFIGDIINRNDALGLVVISAQGIVNSTCNDVAMTVAPGAPIDALTGLPIPTIVVATADGISIIDGTAGVGTIIDLVDVSGDAINNQAYDSAGNLFFANSTQGDIDMFLSTNLNADNTTPDQLYDNTTIPALLANPSATKYGLSRNGDGIAVGHATGLTLLDHDVTTKANGMVAHITKDYNTGWMKGDIRRAFICEALGTTVAVGATIPDSSVKATTLTKTGTLSYSPVATGAELQAISGFSASNYLSQAYSADLDFGTGDFYIAGWSYNPGGSRMLVDRSTVGGGSPNISLYTSPTGTIVASIAGSIVTGTTAYAASTWFFVVVTRIGGVSKVYLNSVLDATSSASGTVTNATAVLDIGDAVGHTDWCLGSLALIRIGAGSLSDEQIAKMYADELPLFQTNAKCTLQGTSNVVQALSYDERYNNLYVGTADGTTVFTNLQSTGLSNITGNIKCISANNFLTVEANDTEAYAKKP